MHRAVLACLLLSGSLSAQPPNSTLPSPRLTSVFPCGGQIGKSVEVILRGSDLDDATSLRFSHPGITAELKKKDPRNPTFQVVIKSDAPQGTHEVRLVGKWGV